MRMPNSLQSSLALSLGCALPAVTSPTPEVRTDGAKAALASNFDVTGLAAASMGLACAELASLMPHQPSSSVIMDRELSSRWFDMTIRQQAWALPPIWDAIAGLYRCRDRWIRLHTNADAHRAAALQVLQCHAERESVATAVAHWTADDLESAIIKAGGCAAAMMSLDQWNAHPQGAAVSLEPLIAWQPRGVFAPRILAGREARPLTGVRVLDCTRVLAGPVCTRLLAGYGAEVLRIDPPGWAEANIEAEVTLGKRLGTLDLRNAQQLARFKRLLAEADVLVHGYRPGALAGLGLDEGERYRVNPTLIDVALCAYGWSGPWANRRGYDSLVQMSSGIVHEGMCRFDGVTPTPLPVQALDHATGYLMATAALRALRVRQDSGSVLSARLSLARTAQMLIGTLAEERSSGLPEETSSSIASHVEMTSWGSAHRLRFPVLSGCPLPRWDLPARRLHSDPARWSA